MLAIRQLQPRLTLVGLGLGPDTEHAAFLYPVTRANLPAASLASEVGALLQERLLGGA